MAYNYEMYTDKGNEMVHRHLGRVLKQAVRKQWTTQQITDEIWSMIYRLAGYKTAAGVSDTATRECIWSRAEEALGLPRHSLPDESIPQPLTLTWED